MKPSGSNGPGESTGERYRFAGILVDAADHSLTRHGQPLPVEPKAFAVLLLLLRHAGQLVARDVLLDTVWGHRHVTPGVLTRVIAQLRHALDDHAHEPRYIQTAHALGYRFIGVLESEGKPVAPTPSGAGQEVAELPVAPVPAVESPGIAAALLDEVDLPDPERVPPADPGDLVDSLVSAGSTESRMQDSQPDFPEVDGSASRSMPSRHSAWHARPWLLAAGCLMVAVAALAWMARPEGQVAPPSVQPSIAVLPFTSLSSQREDSYFAEGLAIEMHDALAGVRGLKVAAIPSGGFAKAGLADVKTLGKTLGVATVLAASVRREGTRVRVNARLSDAVTGYTLWSKSYDRETSDVFALQSEIASQVVQSLLGVLPWDRPRLDQRLAPTRDPVAYDAYLKGLQQLQISDGDDGPERAIGFFGEALAADRGFARAQAGICRAEIARFEAVRDASVFTRARAACQRAARMDPALREVSLATGELHRVRGEADAAIEQYSRALEDMALRPAAYIGLGRLHGALGDNQLSLDYFQRARALRPGDSVIYREIGYQQYLADDLPGAIESFRAAATLQPDNAGAWNSLGGLYLAHGDPVQAAKAFSRSLSIKPSYGALSNLGTLRYGEGAYAEAAELYRRAAQLDPDDYRVWGNIGDALAALPATAAQAPGFYRRAADRVARYVQIKPDDAQAFALLGWYRANLGERDLALDALARAGKLSSERGEVALLGAQTLAKLGDVEGARAQVTQARALGISLQRLRASPVLRRARLVEMASPPPPAPRTSRSSEARPPPA